MVRAVGWGLVLGLAALAGLTGGCTQGGGQTASETGDGAGGDGGGASGAASAEAAGEDAVRWVSFTSQAPPGMPLEPYFAALGLEDAMFSPRLEQAQVKVYNDREVAVAACMTAAGFTYYPATLPEPGEEAGEGSDARGGADWRRDRLQVPQLGATREDVAQHGYGRWDYFADPPEAIDLEGGDGSGEPLALDPQAEYMMSLSEAALDAYYKALEGLERTDPDEWTTTDQLGDGDSCRDQAYRQFPDPVGEAALASATYGALVAGMMDVEYQADNDSRTLALDREWAACVAEQGFDVSEEHVIGDGGEEGVISGPVQALYLAVRTGADGQAAPRDRYGDFELPQDQRTLIQSPPELAVALADFDCRVETDYMARLIAIQTELEAAFLEENRAALDQMLAAVEANLAAG
ncbi:MAG: hypothetical protein LBG60_09205 [Bifidobacteriaceae bacterium]|jgi:hypothetical protein|nr:hypothetical protein [Bifidobacteriaceae bacterium]